jgi:hypothetical protein
MVAATRHGREFLSREPFPEGDASNFQQEFRKILRCALLLNSVAPAKRMSVPYRHKQMGVTILAALGLGAALCLLLATAVNATDARLTLFLLAAVLGICAIVFSSLTIELSEGSLSWRFGPGLVRKQVATAEITSAVVTETRLIHGWGVHLTRNGWLYNVSGFGAVQVTLRSGKTFLLGSDEPEELCSALQHAMDGKQRWHLENVS